MVHPNPSVHRAPDEPNGIVGGKYAIVRKIGQGGMGAVYEAEHAGTRQRVAIKLVDREFAKDERVVGRFAREARAASALESAHIVRVLDAGTDDGRPYLVMELLRGEDLGARLARVGKIPAIEALHVAAQVLRGLQDAHDAGIVHRDLKPDNIFLVSMQSDSSFVKIVDFGVSKIQPVAGGTVPLALTGKGTVLGTPLYLSPEQAQAASDLDGRADLYSVGAILFECLTGRPPHTGSSYEQIILSICMTDAPLVRSIDACVSEALSSFVARALARNRDERFQSAAQMLAALHELALHERAHSRREAPIRAGGSSPLGVVLTAFAAMVAGVIVALVVATFVHRRRVESPPHPVEAPSATNEDHR